MTLRHRLDAGWPIERALSTSVGEQSSSFNLAKQIKDIRAQQDRIESQLNELLILLKETD